MKGILQDVRFALRMMMRSPGFTFMAAFTLALGIGVNSVGFSIAAGTLLKSLPFPDADEIVAIGMTDGTFNPDEAPHLLSGIQRYPAAIAFPASDYGC